MYRRQLMLVLISFCLAAFSVSAWAGPTDAVSVDLPPDGQGDAFVPGVRLVEDLPAAYVEEEFFVSGESTLFNYAHNPPLGPTDLVAIAEDVPYKTRIIVRRPDRANKFNGTVVIEWWNSTAGFDTAPVWDPSADYFANEGIIYVGVTNSTTSLGFLVGGCSLLGVLPPTCGTRYETLSLPENGLAFEMVSQIATLLKSGGPDSPIPQEYDVERVLHAGESQQGGSMVTYASAFHLPGINDGYFVQSAASARRINFGPVCGAEGSPSYPDCTPLLAGADRLVRTDLPVPTYQLVTETDVAALFGIVGRQADTANFRYYEVAGAAHLTVHKDVVIVPAGLLGPDPILLEDLCENEINSTGDGPVFAGYVLNALWQRMQEQIEDGTPAPDGVLMDDVGGLLQRDAFGNVTGGVRLPSMEVPTATYFPINQADPNLPPFLVEIGNLACFLGGSVFPFDAGTLDAVYPTHDGYTDQVGAAVDALKQQGLLLQQDAVKVKKAAAQAPIGE